MDKLGQIKARIMEHKSEFTRLMGLSPEDKASKYVKLQTLHVLKAIQNLTGRYVKSGGKLADLENKTIKMKQSEDIKIVDPVEVMKVDIAPSTKTKRGRKTK